MSSYTPNVLLYKKDPTVDGADTFNIVTMLNENWDKIDSALGAASNITDSSTGLKYKWGVSNGQLYIEEVE